ncbi:hypothetical protein Ciccas_009827 [Cichlidogyrus casuarinus]|uniref:Uncharacterized protein n=1 Tax=Cichlidogyrus casuarinus TaxID=1844966 RepID=A0ABD2PYQ3_9PLAT
MFLLKSNNSDSALLPPSKTISAEEGVDVIKQMKSLINSDQEKVVVENSFSNTEDLDECTKNVLKNAGVKKFQDSQELEEYEALQANIEYAERHHTLPANTVFVQNISGTGEVETIVDDLEELELDDVASACGYKEKTKEAMTVLDALNELDPSKHGRNLNIDPAKLKNAKMIAMPGQDQSRKTANLAISFIQNRATTGSVGRMNLSTIADDSCGSTTESKQSRKSAPQVSKKLKDIGRKGDEAFAANDKMKAEKFKNKGLNESRIMELQDFL